MTIRQVRAALVHAVWLAFREIVCDPRITICFVIAFVGAATPLLLLYSLKEGALGVVIEELIDNPRHREIIAVGARNYDAAFAEAAATLPQTAFFSLDTRNISSRFAYVRHKGTRSIVEGLALLPTAANDPIYPGQAPNWDKREVLLTASAAKKLDAKIGDQIEGVVERARQGQSEQARVILKVTGIIPAELVEGRYILAPLPLLTAVENFLDTKEIAPDAWLDPRPRDRYASFRAYAHSVHEVEALLHGMEKLGATARIRSADAAAMLRLDRMLTILYAIVATCGVLGFFVALAGSLRANVERQRQTFALMRLMGAPPSIVFTMTMTQAYVVVACGLLISSIIYFILFGTVNLMFNDLTAFGGIRLLSAGGGVLTVVVCLLGAAGAAFWGSVAALRIPAADALRS